MLYFINFKVCQVMLNLPFRADTHQFKMSPFGQYSEYKVSNHDKEASDRSYGSNHEKSSVSKGI